MANRNLIRRLVSFGLTLAFLADVSSAVGQQVAFDKEAVKVKDSVVLKSGSKLLGVVKSEGKDDDGRKFIIFETENGGLLKIDVARMVDKGKIHKLDDLDQEYNQGLDLMEDTAEDHWKICKWLEDQPSGKVRFKDQIQFHLERIMELDPNDDRVKRRLNFEYITSQDRWVPSKSYRQSLGYQKRGTSWIPVLQKGLSERYDRQNSIEGERKKAFAIWKKEVRKSNANLAAIRSELFRICDADAVALIFNEAKKENNEALRAMYVEAFGRVPTYVAQRALCYFAVEDPVESIRDRALTLAAQEHYNPESAAAVFAGYLKHPSNAYVLRSAFAIGELGSENSVLPLVGSLVTRHVVAPGDQPGRMNPEFGNGGTGEFKFGGDAKPTILAFENQEVVTALRKITKQDFGFNSAAWKSWYIQNHTHHDIKVRR